MGLSTFCAKRNSPFDTGSVGHDTTHAPEVRRVWQNDMGRTMEEGKLVCESVIIVLSPSFCPSFFEGEQGKSLAIQRLILNCAETTNRVFDWRYF